MKRRTFLKGLFVTTVALPAIPTLALSKDKYSFTITQLEVVNSEKQFSRLVRGLATLDARPEHSCQFCYEILDADMKVEDSFSNAHDVIRSFFINKDYS